MQCYREQAKHYSGLDNAAASINALRSNAALRPWGVIPALLSVLVAAFGKEVWDAQGHGTPDRIDALATVAGGVLMLGWLSYIAPILT